MFHLGGAGGYPIVPVKDTIEINAALPCLEQKGEIARLWRRGLRKKHISGYIRHNWITWQGHRGGEPQCWQRHLILYQLICIMLTRTRTCDTMYEKSSDNTSCTNL